MTRARTWLLLLLLAGLCGALAWMLRSQESSAAHAGVGHPERVSRSITDTGFAWPSWAEVQRTFQLRDYNTRVVFSGVTVLGAAAGLVGTFLLLRKRSLLSDTVSHCTLPGIALAFLIAESLGHSGRELPVLLGGAVVTGVLGMMAVAFIRSHSRIKDDAALAIVLSVFFGGGIALMVIVQQMPTGNVAGLSRYIYGKAASMTLSDAQFILIASLIVATLCGTFYKELKLLCFDSAFARTQGWPVLALDLALMGLVVAVTVIGLQAVGLLLVVALLIIPPAAARFWSHRLGATMLLSAAIGAFSGFVGVAASALFPKLPAGAVIVLAAVACFAASFVFGAQRGLLVRWLERRRVGHRVAHQHILRAIYEWCETHAAAGTADAALLDQPVVVAALAAENHWTPHRLRQLLRLGLEDGLILLESNLGVCRLTAQGRLEARRVTRNHRLWETYLLHFADVAPQHIHHNADQIEHVVDPVVMNELEELLAGRYGAAIVPADPEHPIPAAPGGTSA
jgi:manganese/zinc/iron transport system permease protein